MSTSTRLRELQVKRKNYVSELEDLHINKPSERWYKQRRYELESYIVMIDDAIDDIERNQKMMRPFFWTTVAFVIAAAGIITFRFIFK
jgi:hypothetical protein